jgi:inositol-phosphate transport system substrate-binding protein
MFTKRWVATFVAVVVILSLLAACGPAPTPEVIEKVVKETVVVEKEVEVEVEKEVEVEVEVTKIVEVEKTVEVAGKVFELEVWTWAGANDHERAVNVARAAPAANKMLEAEGKTERIVVKPVDHEAGWPDYKKKFVMAAEAGEAPHIVLTGHEDVPVWGTAGYITSFEACRGKYPQFDDVFDSLWFSTTWGELWGVPQDTEARPMYFNKTKLKELGWSEEEVESLPDRIKSGEWTLEDLIATGKEALEKGVVEPGYAYWHRPRKGGDYIQFYFAYGGELYDAEEDKLVLVEDALLKWYQFQRRVVEEGLTPEGYIGTEWAIWHDTVSHGNCLFWNGGAWQWADWAKNYVKDLGGEDYLFENFGYALEPAGEPGQKAGTLSHPCVYLIASEEATGDKGYYDLACAALAATTTPEIQTLHAVPTAHLGILKSQADYEPYAKDRFLTDVLSMLDDNYYQPNHVMYGPYFDIVWDFMVKAENGELSPEDAAAQCIALLKAELGEHVIFK